MRDIGHFGVAQGTRATFAFYPINKLTPCHHMKEHGESGHLINFDAFRMNRD